MENTMFNVVDDFLATSAQVLYGTIIWLKEESVETYCDPGNYYVDLDIRLFFSPINKHKGVIPNKYGKEVLKYPQLLGREIRDNLFELETSRLDSTGYKNLLNNWLKTKRLYDEYFEDNAPKVFNEAFAEECKRIGVQEMPFTETNVHALKSRLNKKTYTNLLSLFQFDTVKMDLNLFADAISDALALFSTEQNHVTSKNGPEITLPVQLAILERLGVLDSNEYKQLAQEEKYALLSCLLQRHSKTVQNGLNKKREQPKQEPSATAWLKLEREGIKGLAQFLYDLEKDKNSKM